MTKKKKSGKIFRLYIPCGAALLGFGFLVYGILLQTEMFTLPYVNWMDCLMAMTAGAAAGLLLMRYMKKQGNAQTGGRKIHPSDLASMMAGNEILLLLCLLMLFPFCISVAVFLFAIGGITYAVSSILFYLIWYRAEEKSEKEKNGTK